MPMRMLHHAGRLCRGLAFVGVPVLALSLGAPWGALANLVVQGGFEEITNGPGEFGPTTTATGWTSPDFDPNTGMGFNWIFNPSSAGSFPGTPGAGGGYIALWGPGTDAASNLPSNGL